MNLPDPASLVQCYWVLPGRFLAGQYPAHVDRPQVTQRLDALLDASIDAFFDLTEPGELESYLPLLRARAELRGRVVSYARFPMPDFGLPKRADMLRLLDAIDTSLADGRNIYIHCWGGVGRTGLTVACYLVRHGSTGVQALDQIAAWRQDLPILQFHPRSPETDEQVAFVKGWSESASLPAR